MFSKKKTTAAYSVEKCTKCGLLRKRGFVPGDVLFASSKCDCGETVIIEKIFGETI